MLRDAERDHRNTSGGVDGRDAAVSHGPNDLSFLTDLKKGSATSDAVEHLATDRPWGSYRRIDIGYRYQVKRITVAPGGRLSLQKHHHRAEHWIIVAGTAEVTKGSVTHLLHEGDHLFIPQGEIHRCTNPGKVPLVLIEVQMGTYTGEDDIVRIDDVYGRK